MKYAFFIVLPVILVVLFVYIFMRGGQALRGLPTVRLVYYLSISVMLLSLFLGQLLSVFTDFWGVKIIAFIGNSALLIFLYLIISFLLCDLFRLAVHVFQLPFPNLLLFRRYFFFFTLAVTFTAMLVGYVRYRHPSLVNLDLTAQNVVLQGKTLKIVAASDLHLGANNDKAELKRFVKLINAQNPDIVLLAGDICDSRLQALVSRKMEEEFRTVSAPLGVFAVTGNHEFISGNVEAKADFYQKCNIRLLRDSAALVNNDFYILGRDDLSNPQRKSLNRIMENISENKPCILLDHQPTGLWEAADNKIDLQISGHTHDGQFFPVNLIVRAIFEQPHGYLHKNSTHYYVSSGLGIWGPKYRIATQSELVIVNFKY
jgi:predicted MPP superfamily phosphohydrolase